ncbi:MAG: ATP-dependent helicase RuvB, partial [Nitrospirae bacterium]|nr:ATP-dependent helicase RuvB [Nitrospirota bacterium]
MDKEEKRKDPLSERLISPVVAEDEQSLDLNLRPRNLDDFVGQEKLKDNLRIFIQAAKQRKEPLDHVLFCGPPGLGKTTLAHIISSELQVSIKGTSGPMLERPGDLAAILTNLSEM